MREIFLFFLSIRIKKGGRGGVKRFFLEPNWILKIELVNSNPILFVGLDVFISLQIIKNSQCIARV